VARRMLGIGASVDTTFPDPPVPTINSLTPATGVAAGGDSVRISMTHVPSGATITATFGGTSATVTAVSYGEGGYVDVTTPARSAGDVDVSVAHVYGTSTIIQGFAYTFTQVPLTAGTATASSGSSEVLLSATAPTGGTAPYSYQWYRSTTNGVKGSALSGATALSHTDSTVVNGTTYYYTLTATDSAGSPASVDYTQKSAAPGVYATPNVVSSSFEDGTGAGFNIGTGGFVIIVNDPTPRASGKVVSLHYSGSSSVERKFTWGMGAAGTWGGSVWIRAKVFIPTNATPSAMRKLIYVNGGASITLLDHPWMVIKQHGVNASGQGLLKLEGSKKVDASSSTYIATIGTIGWDTWTSLEMEFKINSAYDVTDGEFRAWVDGTLVKNEGGWAWKKSNVIDNHFVRRVEFGTQWQTTGAVDEYRYFDDAAISTAGRIGP
jgi:hypothetical protein